MAHHRKGLPLTARLKALIEMRQTDPKGHEHGSTPTFGNEVGDPIKSIKKEWKAVRLAAGVVK